MAEKEAGEQNLHLDSVTGEMVSKNELKKRQKQREKEEKRQAKQKEAGEQPQAQSGESTSKAYYEGRVREIEEQKATGESPYVYKVHVTLTVQEFVQKYKDAAEIVGNGSADETAIESLCGRVMSIRTAGQNLAFLALEESGSKIQVFCSQDKETELLAKVTLQPRQNLAPNQHTLTLQNIEKASNYEALTGKVFPFFKTVGKLKRGDIVNVVGFPGRTNTGELSIFPIQLIVTSPCLHMLPKANQKLLDVEARYSNRAMDLFFNKKAAIIYQRVKLIQFMKDIYIRKYNFLEVETPLLHMIKGGANAKPFTTHYNDLDQDVYLRISPELFLKQLTIGGIHRVFDMNRNFRNESIDQTHMPEFTMVESYCAYWDLYDQLEFVEDFISSTVRYCNVTFNGVEDKEDNPDLYRIKYTDWKGQEYNINFKPPFRRVDIMSSLNQIISKKLGETVEIPKPYGGDECNKYLQNLIFERLLKKKIIAQDDLPTAPYTTSRMIDNLVGNFLEKMTHDPMFLLHHPKIMSPLAKPKRDDPEVTERFELFCAMFELANAYTELNDPLIQRENFENQLKDKAQGDDEAQDMDEGFLKAMEYGMVQQSGLGIGIDRFIMLLCNQASIREVIAFPPLRRKRDELGGQQ